MPSDSERLSAMERHLERLVLLAEQNTAEHHAIDSALNGNGRPGLKSAIVKLQSEFLVHRAIILAVVTGLIAVALGGLK